MKTLKDKKVERVHFTHLDKVLWPEEGYTKGEMLHYYEEISSVILPYLKDRPLILNRFPNGIHGKNFFQKNILTKPEWLEVVPITHSNRVVRYAMAQDLDSLLYIANMGCIELNPFHSRIDKIGFPTYLVLDLDPESVPFDEVVHAAQMIHKLLEELEIPSYCKTSGGRGLHIYVPLGEKYSYDQAEELARLIALLTLEKLPHLISLERSPSKRQNKIYIDVPRNTWGQSIAAPYSLRPRMHAPVSTPLEWKEVKKGLNPLNFTIRTLLKRVDKLGDLFSPLLQKGINLRKVLNRMEKMEKRESR